MTIIYILIGIAVIGCAWMFWDAHNAPYEDELWDQDPDDTYEKELMKRNKERKP